VDARHLKSRSDEAEAGPFRGIRPINGTRAVRDPLAGFTVAAINVPQVLGYTRNAGTRVVTGLYTLLLPLVAFAAFGSSRYLVVAADSATAAILAGRLSHMAPIASDYNVAWPAWWRCWQPASFARKDFRARLSNAGASLPTYAAWSNERTEL
jgi:Sulfate permease family